MTTARRNPATIAGLCFIISLVLSSVLVGYSYRKIAAQQQYVTEVNAAKRAYEQVMDSVRQQTMAEITYQQNPAPVRILQLVDAINDTNRVLADNAQHVDPADARTMRYLIDLNEKYRALVTSDEIPADGESHATDARSPLMDIDSVTRGALKLHNQRFEAALTESATTTAQLCVQLPLVISTSLIIMLGSALSLWRYNRNVRTRQDELQRKVNSDPLTGLANLSAFEDELNQVFAFSDNLPGLLMIDLDRFKEVNDTHGHLVGDKLLIDVAHALRTTVREDDLAARLGGDEFAILLTDVHGESRIAERIVARIAEVGKDYGITCSVGMAVASDGDCTPEDLRHRADEALYVAKRAGRNQWRAASLAREHIDLSLPEVVLDSRVHDDVVWHDTPSESVR